MLALRLSTSYIFPLNQNEGIRKDFETYDESVKKGGIVTFHDIVPDSPENVGGVRGFGMKLNLTSKIGNRVRAHLE